MSGAKEKPETCEGGNADCGPVEFHDVDGVPLCKLCWDDLLTDAPSHAAD
jgi:hypothetical protein